MQVPSLSVLGRIIRFHEYGPCYLISALACAFLAQFPVDAKIVPLLLFVVASSMFGFVINDIADAELDRQAGKMRNPVASGDMAVYAAWVLVLVLVIVSLSSLYLLSGLNRLLGILVLILFSVYSLWLRIKSRPVLDVICHASWNATYGIMAYSVYRSIDFVGAGFGVILFMLSMLAELTNEVRDYDSDKVMIRTTATLIGKRNTLLVCIVLLLSVFSILVSMVLFGGLPWILIIFSPAIFLLVLPIVNAIKNEQRVPDLLPALVKRGTIIGVLLLVVYVAAKIFTVS